MASFKDDSGLNPTKPKTPQAKRDELMKKFLEKGGKIQKAKPGYPKNANGLRLAWTREEVLAGKTGASPMPDYTSLEKPNDMKVKERKDRKVWW
jgi:hypothetical protein